MFLGSVVGSVGILFSAPGVSTLFDLLRPYALSIILFCEAYSPLRLIPTITSPEVKKDVITSTSWSTLGFIDGGVVSFSFDVGLIHFIFPSAFVKIPVIGSILACYAGYVNEAGSSFWSYVCSYFPITSDPPKGGHLQIGPLRLMLPN